jgi:hypothetical protein
MIQQRVGAGRAIAVKADVAIMEDLERLVEKVGISSCT